LRVTKHSTLGGCSDLTARHHTIAPLLTGLGRAALGKTARTVMAVRAEAG
jgi:hypothetical protein